MIQLWIITNSPALAALAEECGVNRIFVDLESIGKYERQGQADTWISHHGFEDVSRVRKILRHAELLVRLNPFHPGTSAEVDEALDRGADLVMLPMYRSATEVASLAEMVAGRSRVVPLLETSEALVGADQVAKMAQVDEMYVGLNDLHLAMKKRFMFEPLADGTVDRLAGLFSAAGKPFGFGGIARIGEGQLPSELVLGEHLRLGSTRVILSRTFQRGLNFELEADRARFRHEVARLREAEIDLAGRSSAQIELDRRKVAEIIRVLAGEGS